MYMTFKYRSFHEKKNTFGNSGSKAEVDNWNFDLNNFLITKCKTVRKITTMTVEKSNLSCLHKASKLFYFDHHNLGKYYSVCNLMVLSYNLDIFTESEFFHQ